MDINSYKVFVEVARVRNISKAADNLGYTQSGISHTIKRLESEFELPLFDRSRNGAELTTTGRALFPYISQIVFNQNSLEQTVTSLRDLHEGTLNIATFSSVAREWLPNIIYYFKQDYPDIEIHFKEGGINEIINWLENREVDFAFMNFNTGIHQYDESNYNWIPLYDDPFLAVLPEDYEYAYDEFRLEDFNEKLFIISAYGVDYSLHKILKENNIKPNIQYSAHDDATIVAMVARGLGLSILPSLVARKLVRDVRCIPITPRITRTIGIAMPSSNMSSPAVDKFIEYTHKYMQE